MQKKAFSTSDIARICHHSRETVKRWLEKGEIKGYRVGTSGHWRVLPKDLASFLAYYNIPFPNPAEIGFNLKELTGEEGLPTFCWEFFKASMNNHVRSNGSCEDCLVYKTKSFNCYSLREEIGHKNIFCGYSCEDCDYFHFQQSEIVPQT
ncbi:MAG: helix-turn-helix domain-containing protein [Deltaproteobacteria bacterium]|nr:helix-turn-helix domain-containing protein [Deltaproteobacteria bacterium]